MTRSRRESLPARAAGRVERASGAAPRPGDEGLPRHSLDVPDPHDLPFAMGSFDRIGPLSRAPFAHRHTFYETVYVTSGEGSHVVDLEERELCPPHLCFVAPGQVHYWREASDLQGRVILFTDDFLLAHPDDRDALRRLSRLPHRRLAAGEVRRIQQLVVRMELEYRRRRPGFRTVLQAYLHVLIVEAGRLHPDAPPGGAEPVTALAKRFQELLRDEGFAEWTVAAYAGRLGVSASYLNEAVRQATGSTPGQMIRQTRALEAKRLLAGTDLTVTQVARRLDFADPAYFCRFFRREAGVTPGAFRSGRREKHQDFGDQSIVVGESGS